MTLEDPSSDEHFQAVRSVYENGHLTGGPTTPSNIIYLASHPDETSGKDILLWDDVLAAFKDDVVHVRSGVKVLPFLKGRDFKNLDPLRIAAVPGATLDVVVRAQLVQVDSNLSQEPPSRFPPDLSLQSLQKSLPSTLQEDNNNSSSVHDPHVTSTATIKRNPAYGLVEVAIENYNHIDNPATAPPRRGPQARVDGQSISCDNISEPVSSVIKNQSRAPQEHASSTPNDFVEMMVRARLGEKDAQVALANMYRDGKGVDQDYQAAMDWYRKAAEQGSAEAQRNIGRIYYYGQEVPQDYDLALEWYQKSADQGYAEGQRNIGNMYLHGRGVTQDYDKAMEWYHKAADQGSAAAQQNIGWLHQYGLGAPKDYAKAMEWYLKAAVQGDAYSQNSVGYMYDYGLGVPQDVAQAVSWYRKAAEKGLTAALFNVGNIYNEGRGVPKDQEKAMEWYTKAADQGYEDAKEKIAILGRQGGSVQTEKKKPGLLRRLFN